MILNLAIAAAIVFGIIYLISWLHGTGKKAQKLEQAEDVIDDIHLAKVARDNLRSDPDAGSRVREKYTRK